MPPILFPARGALMAGLASAALAQAAFADGAPRLPLLPSTSRSARPATWRSRPACCRWRRGSG